MCFDLLAASVEPKSTNACYPLVSPSAAESLGRKTPSAVGDFEGDMPALPILELWGAMGEFPDPASASGRRASASGSVVKRTLLLRDAGVLRQNPTEEFCTLAVTVSAPIRKQ